MNTPASNCAPAEAELRHGSHGRTMKLDRANFFEKSSLCLRPLRHVIGRSLRTPDMAPRSRAGEEKRWHQRSPSSRETERDRPRPSAPERGSNVGRPSAIGDHLFSTASGVLSLPPFGTPANALALRLGLWLVTALACQSACGAGPREFLIQDWTSDNGLPGTTGTAVTQTQEGYLCVGTFPVLAQFHAIRLVGVHLQKLPAVLDPSVPSL